MAEPQKPADGQPPNQVRLHVDERDAKTSYANFFRTNATADEVILDFGMNYPMQGTPPGTQPQPGMDIAVRVSDRIVLNYYSAKRLALTLGQLIQQHEKQFGTLELDVNKRRQAGQ